MELRPGTYCCCTCGLSEDQPFCDGSHHGTDWVPVDLTIEETRRVGLCACKQSKNPPLCDGAHKTLPADED